MLASPPSPASLAASAEIGEDHDDQMCDEPNVFDAEILVDIDQDQDARHEDAKKDIGPLRDGVRREEFGEQEQINQEDDAWEE